MNAKQRGRLLQIVEELRRYYEELETMSTEEQEKYDNLPESIQDCERGEAIAECADALGDSSTYLSDCIETLEAML